MIKSINLIFMTLYFKFLLRFLKIAGIYEIYITNYGVSLWMQKSTSLSNKCTQIEVGKIGQYDLQDVD